MKDLNENLTELNGNLNTVLYPVRAAKDFLMCVLAVIGLSIYFYFESALSVFHGTANSPELIYFSLVTIIVIIILCAIFPQIVVCLICIPIVIYALLKEFFDWVVNPKKRKKTTLKKSLPKKPHRIPKNKSNVVVQRNHILEVKEKDLLITDEINFPN